MSVVLYLIGIGLGMWIENQVQRRHRKRTGLEQA